MIQGEQMSEENKHTLRTVGRRLTNELDSFVTAAHSTPYVEKLSEIERTIDALVAALEKYGRHAPGCNSLPKWRDGSFPCDCGFSAALSSAKGTQG